MTTPQRDTLVQAFKALAAGRPNAADVLADIFLGVDRSDEASPAADVGVQPQTELHTYPDGSQVVGMPPFPEKSPLELQAEEARRASAPAAAPATTAPEPDSGMITADQVESAAGPAPDTAAEPAAEAEQAAAAAPDEALSEAPAAPEPDAAMPAAPKPAAKAKAK